MAQINLPRALHMHVQCMWSRGYNFTHAESKINEFSLIFLHVLVRVRAVGPPQLHVAIITKNVVLRLVPERYIYTTKHSTHSKATDNFEIKFP